MDAIVQYFSQQPAHVFYTITGICLVIELGVLGMSGPLVFIAFGSFLTGVLMSLGLITQWEMAILSLGLITTLSALVLWKPFKRMQNKRAAPDTSSDMVGRVLRVTQPVSRQQGAVNYSGIEWQVRLVRDTEPVAVGALVRVVAIEGGLLLVDAAE